MSPKDKSELIEWLYLNDKKFPSSCAWRKALVEKMEKMIKEEDYFNDKQSSAISKMIAESPELKPEDEA